MSKTCDKCGAKLNDDAKFCNSCGSEVHDGEVTSTDNTERRNKIIIVSLLVIIAILALFLVSMQFDFKGTPTITINADSAITTSDYVTVSLKAATGEGLSDRDISIKFENEENSYEYAEKTDENGNISIKTDLLPGTYEIICKFDGDEQYHQANATGEIEISEPEPDYMSYDYVISFDETDSDGDGYVYLNDMNLAHTPVDSQNQMFEDSDDDHDGKLNEKEYYKFMYKLNYDRGSYGLSNVN